MRCVCVSDVVLSKTDRIRPAPCTNSYNVGEITNEYHKKGGSVAEWLACWTQAQKGLGSNRSRDAVG